MVKKTSLTFVFAALCRLGVSMFDNGSDVLQPAAAHSEAQTGTTHQLPVAINGANEPAAVPDVLAYRHLYKSLLEVQTEQFAEERWRQFVAEARLNDRDAARLKDVIDSVQLAAGSSDRGFSIEGDQTLVRKREVQKLDLVAQQAEERLSAEASLRLLEYVRMHVKRRIVVYGSVPSF